MNKIPTVFVRDFSEPSKGRYVTSEVNPGCEWVLAGEGVPTRKYDGTCVLFEQKRLDDGSCAWWSRREVRAGKEPPPHFVAVETDSETGKTVGWEPASQSGFHKYLVEAIPDPLPPNGTYELCGPKIQGNPEGYEKHVLISHTYAERLSFIENIVPDFKWASEWMPTCPFEGIVWHHPDGRMAKLKKRDFPKAEDLP